MVDYVKRVNKKAADQLLMGENVLAACPVQMPGQAKKQATGAGFGVVGMIAANKMAKDPELAEPGTMAAEFPTDMTVLAVTDQRVIAFEASKMNSQPKGIIKTWRRDELVSMTLEKNRLTYAVGFLFSDGSVATMEVVKAGKPDKVAAALVS